MQMDTTGSVSEKLWEDLSPFAQGYIEALAADNFARIAAMPSDNDETGHCKHCGRDNRGEGLEGIEPGPCSDDCPRQEIRFSDLAPETLARIITDCERFAKMHPTAAATVGGKGAWTERQSGGFPRFPPLTVRLGDDGKVRFQ